MPRKHIPAQQPDNIFTAHGIADPCFREYRFHQPRRWRFDYAFPDKKVYIEVNGGLFIQGAHCRGARLQREHEKRNTATLDGWKGIWTTPANLLTPGTIATIRRALGLPE